MGFFQNTQKPKGLGGKMMIQMMNHGHQSMALWGLSHIDLQSDWKVLDVGCGGGANIKEMLKYCQHVTGIDHSELSVSSSQKMNAQAIEKGICSIEQGDVSHLPYKNDSFDFVSAFETIYFWPGPQQSFKEVYRVLNQSGRFFICNESDGSNPNDEKWEKQIEGMKTYKPEEIKNYLLEIGFKKVEIFRKEKKHWFCLIAYKR